MSYIVSVLFCGKCLTKVAHLQLKAIDSGCALESLGPCEDLDEEIQLLVQERLRLVVLYHYL